MANNYRKFWTSDSYQAEIYDNCHTQIFIRKDGERARVEMDGTKWHGNTGGFHCYKYYIDGRANVKSLVRFLRRGQIACLKYGMDKDNIYALDGFTYAFVGEQY